MKKALALILSLGMLLTMLTACGTQKLTEAQVVACKEADELLALVEEEIDVFSTTSEVKTLDGKVVYIATLDSSIELGDDLTVFKDSVFQRLLDIMQEEDVYAVLYLAENGEQIYRIVDSRLDPSILD